MDYGLVILKHTGGALSHIAGAWAYPPPTFRTHIEIAGDAGLIEFDSDETAPIRNLIAQQARQMRPMSACPPARSAKARTPPRSKSSTGRWARARPLRVSAEDGLAAVQIAEAALESARTGQAVRLAAADGGADDENR